LSDTVETMDTLHILPLAKVPLQTRGLQSVRLIKNSSLHSVVELFADKQTGSGQIEISDLGSRFVALNDDGHPDLALLKDLGNLRSYDVFSLRMAFRKRQIPLDTQDTLRLSTTNLAASATFLRNFTQSLLKETFAPTSLVGADDNKLELVVADEDTQDTGRSLSRMINPTDPDLVHARLGDLAKRLEIRLDALPELLEDFADLYLALSYYENCYGEVMREFDEMFALISQMARADAGFQSDADLLQHCDRIEDDVTSTTKFVEEHLKLFKNLEREFWKDISANRLRQVEDLAKANHARLSGIVCGMTYKMNAWRKNFLVPEWVTPFRVAEFVRSELRGGIGNIYSAA